ncbi:MAG: hypothetical protein NTU76_02250 [Candidatus Taylorbacteria bacterium]|nr:hypothetical protein [Candidatus Taylorbacteria bacterium]
MSLNLNEAWEHLSSHEKGHDFPDFGEEEKPTTPKIEGYDLSSVEIDKNISSLFDLKEVSKIDGIAKELFDDFLKSLLRYISTIDNLTLARMDKEIDRITKNQADHSRRMAHDSWMSNANALSRYCESKSIDNSWRDVIGYERKVQTNWVLSVSNMARKMALKGD